jgi:hypothetical protein
MLWPYRSPCSNWRLCRCCAALAMLWAMPDHGGGG